MLVTNFEGYHRTASTASILVIATREDLTIMRETQWLFVCPQPAPRNGKCPAPFLTNTCLK
jgi:hypothetical protein